MTIVRDQARAAGDRPLEGRALNTLALSRAGATAMRRGWDCCSAGSPSLATTSMGRSARHIGNHDLTSSVSTLRTLGLVRAAQQRDDEAEGLLRQALASVEGTDCRLLELGAAAVLARYLRARGRDSEAEQIEERLPRRIPGWLSRENSTAAPDDSALDERLAATTRRIAD
jgi:hypothetical protein